MSTLVIAHSEKQSVARAQRVAEVDPAYVELEDIAIQKSYEAEIVKSNLEFLEAEYKKWMMQTSYEKAQMGLI